MKKTATNSKKALTTKDQQKISSYFTSLTLKKNESSKTKTTSHQVKHEQPSTSNRNNETKTKAIDTKILTNDKQNTKSDKIKNNLRKQSFNNQDGLSPNNSDGDFETNKKEKVISNILHLKSKHKNGKIKSPKKEKSISPTKCNKENKMNHKIPKKSLSNSPPLIETQNKTNGSNSEESILVIDLDQKEPKTIKSISNNENIFGITPEKTFLKNDDLENLEENQNLNLIDFKLSKNNRKSSLHHSTPQEKIKKRKHSFEHSPDIIPPTPQETEPIKTRRSKFCIENKFQKIEEKDDNEPIIPDMIVASPPKKKRRSSDNSKNKTIINLSNLSANEFSKIHALSFNKSKENSGDQLKLTISNINIKNVENIKTTPTKSDEKLQSTSKFKVTPIKSISPSKSSPHKFNISLFQVSPIKSKRALFENNQETSKDMKQNSLECSQGVLPLSSDTAEINNGTTNNVNVPEDKPDICENGNLEKLPSNHKDKCFESEQNIDSKSNHEKDVEDNFNDLVFDDDWDDEMINIEEKLELSLDKWTYCRVLEVTENIYQNLIVKLQSMENKSETTCSIQGIWQDMKLKTGDFINIMAVKVADGAGYLIDSNNGFLVFEPDFLVSPTSIVGFKYCNRRGILQEKFRGFDPENKIMIVGTLVHKLLEEVLKRKLYTSCLIEKKLIEIITSRNMMNTLYSSQIPLEDLKKEVFPFIPKIVNFINKYILVGKNKSRYGNRDHEDWKGVIHSIHDIEENIWCPQLGMKGKVDVTVGIDERNKKLVPLELKTGRASMSLEHRGQVILYIMMMNELGFNISSGLLLYLREEKLRELSTVHREKRDLLMMRNTFVYFMRQRPKLAANKEDINFDNQSVSSKSSMSVMSESDPLKQLIAAELPEPIDCERTCQQCPYALICTAYLSRDKSYELPKTHALEAISKEVLAHLEPAHLDYFLHWTSLITMENNYSPPIKELKHIWRQEPYKREQRKKSICYLNISGNVYENGDNYTHTFKRTTDTKYLSLLTENNIKNDFIISELVCGNYVVISTDTRVAIATGFIKNINENEIIVSLERNLKDRYNNKLFHIDTYESAQMLSFSMTSIAALIESTEKAKRLREIIIDKKVSKITSFPTEIKKIMFEPKNHALYKRLNKLQQRAVLRAIILQDYLLIKGMPGTGKTATIVTLIQLLVILKKSILITSHTHSAVDNVCLRLLDSGVDFMRLGSESRIHPLLKHRSESALTAHCKTVQEITDVYNNAQVIAVTCLAAGHPLFTQRNNIDICIVDESTQVLQCSLIKALMSCQSFVLIGDPDQLPPIVRNPEAVRRGMNESLFERLTNPKSTVTLTLQYRMNKTITDLANAVTYCGQLLCADDSIGYAILRLPKLERLLATYGNEQWVITALDQKIENAVIAIDTGPTWNRKMRESQTEDILLEMQLAPQNVTEDEERKCSNCFEASIIITIIKALKLAGIQSSTIGVIAPYRAQVELLRKKVAIFSETNSEEVEVNTVDQYQGRDKDVIIYSCTRSRDTSKVKNNTGFEILEDKRRLTVAITRAKHKLIVIGDLLTLKEYTPFNKLISCLKENQILDLNDTKSNFDWNKVCVETKD